MRFSLKLNLEDSATVSINSQVLERKARGEQILNLSAGEPVLPPHPAIVEGATVAMAAGKTGYPPSGGIVDLRRAAAEWINRSYDTQYSYTNTLVTPGGKFGIFAACHALLDPGDEVVIVAPYWVSYPSIVKIFGGVPVIVNTDASNQWRPSADAISAALTERTKIIILNSGSNPTGAVYTRSFLESVLRVAQKRGITVISDEVYSGLTYEGEFSSCGTFPEYKDSLIVINSCSKNFGMTGWRVGFVYAEESVIKILTKLQSQSTSGASIVSQYAALGALQHVDEVNAYVRGEMQKRRDLFVKGLQELLPNAAITAPRAGLYMFLPVSVFGSDLSSEEFCSRLLTETRIASVPGIAFGTEGYVRFSFGEREGELFAALEQLAKFPRK